MTSYPGQRAYPTAASSPLHPRENLVRTTNRQVLTTEVTNRGGAHASSTRRRVQGRLKGVMVLQGHSRPRCRKWSSGAGDPSWVPHGGRGSQGSSRVARQG